MAVIRGSPRRFPALLGWKRHLKGLKFWTVLSLPFHGTSYFERSKPANLGGVQVRATLVQFSRSEIKDLPKTLSELYQIWRCIIKKGEKSENYRGKGL